MLAIPAWLRGAARQGSALVLIVAAGFIFSKSPQILDWLTQPIGGINELQAIEVTEPIGVVMRVTIITAFAVALPYISLEMLLFAAPGLSRRSRFFGLFAIPLVALFFAGGMAFTFYFILPQALPFLLSFMDIPTLVRPSSYISFSTGLMFWIGISFEFPLIAYVLAAMGILPAELLRRQWRIALVLLSVLAAAITPTIDPINMLIVWIPLVLLYFLSVGTASVAERQRRARRAKT
jgi:sec-independent protein translocase protein TatC